MATTARFLQDWLEGWNAHDVDRIMSHYAEDAVFESPSVLALGAGDGRLRGRDAIRALYASALARFPRLRFEMEDAIERPWGLLIVYRKLHVYAESPGSTAELFFLDDAGMVRRNVVCWSVEEVAARFGATPR
jgi:ketosteroid isomerase-like protein